MTKESIVGQPSEIDSYTEAETVVGLNKIRITNPLSSKDSLPSIDLFGKQVISADAIWWLLLEDRKSLPTQSLVHIGEFIHRPKIQHDIDQLHQKILGGIVNPHGNWLTSGILYPLIDTLIDSSTDSYEEVFNKWKSDWETGINPQKFQLILSLVFRILSKQPKEIQEQYIPNLGQVLINPSEAGILGGIFEKVYGENNDLSRIEEADQRNRLFVEKTNKTAAAFTSNDLFHTTDLSTLPTILDKGLLTTECITLTRDMYEESEFAVSMWSFKNPPQSLAELGDGLKTGKDTYRKHLQKMHLSFMNPIEVVGEDSILYPPDSFYPSRNTRRNEIAGRYIAGYDGYDSEFQNKAPAYVLIGLPSTALSFVVLDEKLKGDYAEKAKDFPFYIPAYSYEGRLIYTPQEYDQTKHEK